jgi:hypothetical protein
MKHLLLFLFALLFTAAVFSQNVDTTTNYRIVNDTWQFASRDVTTYDASCRASTTLHQGWQPLSSLWVNNDLTIYTYNSNNRVIQQTTLVWNAITSSWDNSYRFVDNYNSNNLPDSILFQIWVNDNWQDSTLTVNSYNAPDTTIVETWTGTSWISSGYTYVQYNTDKTIDYILGSAGWTRYKVEYNYNTYPLKQLADRDSLIYIPPTTFPYPPKPGYWKLRGYETFTYNNLSTLVTTFIPDGVYWIADSQIYYTYNDDGTLAEFTTQVLYGGALINNTKTTFHYSATCLLPLTLLSFTAALDGKAAQLQWATATEINTKNFIIQRSIDAMHFQNIGSVNAVGNSTQITSYSFADAGVFNAGANKLYYRLQMVDKDGKFTHSNIATVQIADGKLFVVYPNPIKDELLVTTNASLNNAQVRISDPGGRVVYQEQISNTQSGTTKINVSGLGKGVYYLQLITGSNAQTTKLVKY